MKIIVRGVRDEMLKEEIKAIICEYCECDSVYASGFWSGEYQTGHLRGVDVYPVGSKSRIGFILYEGHLRGPKSYTVIKRRQVVKTYVL